MADDKEGRDKQAHDQERRQRKREMKEERERSDEAEPVVDADEDLGELLADHDYPATTPDLVDAFGNREVVARSDSYTLEELLSSIEEDTFDSPEEAEESLREYLERTE